MESITELILRHRQEACEQTKAKIKKDLELELLGLCDLRDCCKDADFAMKLDRRLKRICKILEANV